MAKFVLTPGGAMRGALFDRLMGRDAIEGQLAPGTIVGSFRIIRMMANSASASVYLGRRLDDQSGSVVVIQIAHSAAGCVRSASDDYLRDHHSKRVPVLDSGFLADGRTWVVKALGDQPG